MDDDNVYLVLGCYGRVEDGFILCPSIENRILTLDESLVNIDKIIDYLERVNLFDRPMMDNNAIRNMIYQLQDKFDQKIRKIWSEHQYHLIERFIVMHKPCGLYVRLVSSIQPTVIEPEPVSFVIKATSELGPKLFKPKNQ